MREIKFRGRKVVGDHGWVFGDLVHYCGGYERTTDDEITPVVTEICIECADFLTTVDPDTVGQFTGLRDADGREIYEGDVLEYKTWAETGEHYVTMGEVRFLQGQFLVFGPKDIEVQGLFSVAHEPALSDVLVIGNVHDNPELLEVKSDA